MVLPTGGPNGIDGPAAHFDAHEVTAHLRKRLAADPRPAADGIVAWDIFPFAGELRVAAIADPVLPEPERGGLTAETCPLCLAPDGDYLWVGERWRVKTIRGSSLPVLFLEPRAHLDLDALDEDMAGELGRLVVRVERALGRVHGVGRVHVYRYGDGLVHLHVWFMARPAGMLQLKGFTLPIWGQLMPPLPGSMGEEIVASVAAALAAGDQEGSGGRAVGGSRGP